MAKHEKIKYLEGLRGIAAFVVLLGHLKLTSFITHQQYAYSYIYDLEMSSIFKLSLVNISYLFVDGELAVWIFWILSSYVISIIFFKKQENYDKILIAYFSKRYFRLFVPVFFSILFAYALLKLGFMHNKELATLLGFPYLNGWLDLYYDFEPNFYEAIKSAVYSTFFDFQSNTSYNAVLWTIQNEFLGSLFTFSIFGIIRHNSQRHILYFFIVITLIKLQIFWLCAFVIGHILCDYDHSDSDNKLFNQVRALEFRAHEFKLIALVLSIAFVVFSPQIMSLLDAPINSRKFILSTVIVYFTLRNNYYKRFFSSRISFWLGSVSFSLYLIHLPIICSLTCYLILLNNTLYGKIVASLITIAIVLILSYFFTKYIDNKSIAYANRIGDYFKKHT